MQVLYRSISTTPYGAMTILASEKGLCALEFSSPQRQEMLKKRLHRYFLDYEIKDTPDEIITATDEWLGHYFAGEFDRLCLPSLDLRGTPFEIMVWQTLLRIPVGKTATYRSLACELGKPGGARAVGGASRRNPAAIIVPCHRIIGHNGDAVGYGGGIEIKKALIAHEKHYRTR